MLGILLKWGGAGLLAGTVVAGGAAGVDRVVVSGRAVARSHAESAPPAVTAANPSPDLPQPAPPRAPPAAVTAETAPQASPKRPLAVMPPASVPAAVHSSEAERAPAPEPSAEPASAQEVALVDAAMSALRSGDAAKAARSLADYEKRFVPAHLEPEVLFLRMAAAQARGDAGEAHRNAELIVRAFPKSPGVGRAEEILRGGGAKKE